MNRRAFFSTILSSLGAAACAPLLKLLPKRPIAPSRGWRYHKTFVSPKKPSLSLHRPPLVLNQDSRSSICSQISNLIVEEMSGVARDMDKIEAESWHKLRKKLS